MKTRTIYLTCAFIILCISPSYSQKKPEHTKKHFVDSEQKLFWQKQMPLYLFASSTPDNENALRLKNDQSEHADPMYLDTEGINFIRSKWAVDEEGKYLTPMQEVMFEIYADGIAPKTFVLFEGAPKYTNAARTVYYGEGLMASATSKDEMSKVENTWFSLNKKEFQIFDQPISLQTEGDHSLTVYAVDNVGNVEEESNYSFNVDLTPPQTTHVLSKAGSFMDNIISIRTRLSLTPEDDLSGVSEARYKLNDQAEAKYDNKVNFESLADGEHTLAYYAIDNVNNQEVEKVFDFYYDKTPPEVVAEVLGDQFKIENKVYISRLSKVQLTATDNKAGVDQVYYTLGNKPQQTYTEPFNLELSHGSYELSAYSIDKVGNIHSEKDRDRKSTKVNYLLDLQSPVVSATFMGSKYHTRDTTFITDKTLIKLMAEDRDSGVKEITFTLNGEEKKVYNEPFTINDEGFYTVSYTATDKVNNSTTDEFTFYVDKTGPVINYTVSMDAIGKIDLNDQPADMNVYTVGSKLYLAASDKIIGTESIHFKLNDGRLTKYAQPIILTNKGIVNVEVTSSDYLKNESNEKQLIAFFVK